ncbi:MULTISPECIES: enhanced serine sensitivity protein SseB C-terminal domain-containing protein [unclassified Mesobacillus]|uniref:enhanced serine sensitivity protein SseB C-terminal domain-containing protein n=1 Tax=unclassified Mesobacillus TaxID=2675270 RepID=UPI002040818B|nr:MULTISPECIES: enhanced serine sensitivity protein SseB C-terminal domain-containing protein [unclassified Mesobacillus]MCM3124412.1 enhanced serine sensitivity protein SseB C-terminal domain-containing protein [Mesobacillus sp. MER 33]MCM3234878.1 enhanced serine sensitivity protein SseB C-terminal domain-containing protein [Mesobacillus sp. MER 48]
MNNHVIESFDDLLSGAIEEPSRRFQFYKALVELELVVIGSVADDETLNLKYIEEDGELVLPVFTSWEKFNAIIHSEYPYVKIPAELLLEMTGTEIPWVLNPFTGLSKKIICEELETMKDGRILHYFFEQLSDEEKERILTEQIVELPEVVIERFRSCLQKFPSVKKAYLVNIYIPSAVGRPFPLVALDVDDLEEGLTQEVFDAINQRAEQQVEVLILDDAIPLASSIVEDTRPFYFRESLEEFRTMFD